MNTWINAFFLLVLMASASFANAQPRGAANAIAPAAPAVRVSEDHPALCGTLRAEYQILPRSPTRLADWRALDARVHFILCQTLDRDIDNAIAELDPEGARAEAEVFSAARDCPSVDAYLRRYTDGRFVLQARQSLQALGCFRAIANNEPRQRKVVAARSLQSS